MHFLNGNPGFDISVVGSQDLFVDEIPEVGPYAASVRSAARPKAVFIEPGHNRWISSGGTAALALPCRG